MSETPDLPIGDRVGGQPARRPERIIIDGQIVRLEPLDADKHGASIWAAIRGAENDGLWAYMFDGPFSSPEELQANLEKKSHSEDPLFFAIVDRASGEAIGHASFLRIEPTHRVIEVGNIVYSPRLQKTIGATEAMYLMVRHAFDDLGYRRYEWKCNALNAPSRKAALRYGFQFEGVFRQHMIVKGRNRDTAWFAMTDAEWPARKAAFERWLDPSNFNSNGRQIRALGSSD